MRVKVMLVKVSPKEAWSSGRLVANPEVTL
jgi:hypothetical protein